MSTQSLSKAIAIVGLQPLAKACGVTYQALRKWESRGRLPRTEWTGETHYATIIERETGGEITRDALLVVTAPAAPVECGTTDPRHTPRRDEGAEPKNIMREHRATPGRRDDDLNKEAA